MKQFLGKSQPGLFATKTLMGHVIRGAVAFALLYLAIEQQHLHPVGGFAGVSGYAWLPGLLDDRAGRNHWTALWGDSKLRCAAQTLMAGDSGPATPELNSLDRWPLLAAN